MKTTHKPQVTTVQTQNKQRPWNGRLMRFKDPSINSTVGKGGTWRIVWESSSNSCEQERDITGGRPGRKKK